ncbi:hypothetical protein PUN28_004954 [Cardiocondyla obscurior]|uniref:Uncharacterized protein n=1 Tax=Cardiocondyla obscurior TaxID=286306 RepID=A0AAW2GH66_9HYME
MLQSSEESPVRSETVDYVERQIERRRERRQIREAAYRVVRKIQDSEVNSILKSQPVDLLEIIRGQIQHLEFHQALEPFLISNAAESNVCK